jgi:hypothetical protein
MQMTLVDNFTFTGGQCIRQFLTDALDTLTHGCLPVSLSGGISM